MKSNHERLLIYISNVGHHVNLTGKILELKLSFYVRTQKRQIYIGNRSDKT